MRQRIALLIPAVALAGCVASSSGETLRSKGDAAAIRTTLQAAIHEATDGSAQKTCSYVTRDAQAWAIAGYGFRHKRHFGSCAEMVEFARRVEAPYLDDARRSTVRAVRIRDAVALAVVEGPRTRLPGDKRGYGGEVGVWLTRSGDRWKASSATFVPAPFSSGR